MKGHLKFSKQKLRLYKKLNQRDNTICTDCMEKHIDIQKKLRLRGSWRCRCPLKNSIREHNPSNQLCDLHEQVDGSKRWPGKNNGVSQEDFDFHVRMKSRQKL